jgi:endonuclease/exonuclease/phosphatase (EEP) superfamily protein YafD
MGRQFHPPRVAGLVEVIAWLSAAGFLLGYLGKSWWGFDLLSHFRVQYAGALACSAAILALSKRPRLAILALAASCGIALTLIPFSKSPPARAKAGHALTIVSFNVNTANTRHGEALEYLLKTDADVIFLMEVSEEWIRDLHPLIAKYPFHLESPRDDNFGVAMYSRRPFERAQVTEFGPVEVPVVEAELNLGGSKLQLVGLHTLPPINALHSKLRNEELLHYAELAARADPPTVLMGDFNLTPFSPWFAEILRRSTLSDTAANFVWSPTWMRNSVVLGLRIDQMLIPNSFTLISREIGPACGSDHCPVEVRLSLPAIP